MMKTLDGKCGMCNRSIAANEQATFDWANGGFVHLKCYQQLLGQRYVQLSFWEDEQ